MHICTFDIHGTATPRLMKEVREGCQLVEINTKPEARKKIPAG